MIAQFGIVEFPKVYFTRFHINLIREEMDMFLIFFVIFLVQICHLALITYLQKIFELIGTILGKNK